jgi:hypothetical protein
MKMNLLKSWILCAVLWAIVMICAIFIFPNQVNNFNIPNQEMFNYPLLLMAAIILYSVIITVWAYIIYYLVDRDNFLCFLLAVIVGGIFLTFIFLGFRWIYRKLGFKFLN